MARRFERAKEETLAILERGPRTRHSVTAALPNGRYLQGCRVRIEIVDRTEYPHMAEVQVFHQDKNLALRGTARQSSTTLDAAAQRAIDGNTDGAWAGNSVSHTQREPHPWWEVDLGHDQPVDRIVIWNRTDGGLRTRLRGFRVSLWNHAGDLVWQRIVAAAPDPNCELFVSPIPVQLRIVSAARGPISTTPGSRSTTIHKFGRAIGCADRTPFALRLTPAAFGIGAGTRLRVSLTHAPPPLCAVPANVVRPRDALVQPVRRMRVQTSPLPVGCGPPALGDIPSLASRNTYLGFLFCPILRISYPVIM